MTTIMPRTQAAIVPPGTRLEEFEMCCGLLAEMQRDVLWQLGDVALALERQHPQTFNQAWPVWVSPDLISRCKGVASAYKPDERNPLATWTVHAKHAKDPQRVALVQASVDAGQTSDEARKNPAPIVQDDPPAVTPDSAPPAEEPKPVSNAWLLCVDISYYVQRMFPMHGVSTAVEVCAWLVRVIKHLRDTKNLTDVVVCFDGPNNHRKALTKDWEFGYKWKRTDKDDELVVQLRAMPERLKEMNLPCVSIEGMEADDVMASYVEQFDGKVTLMTADKDLRQCLGPKCNILRDVQWETNIETGQLVRTFDWVSAKKHTEEGVKYGSTMVSGITPELWPHFQAIAGDPTDDIKGCEGIGGTIAMKLILAHGTVQNVIAAAKDGSADLTAKKIESVLAFEPFAETTLLLTTMRTDLQVPMVTKLAMKEDV